MFDEYWSDEYDHESANLYDAVQKNLQWQLVNIHNR